MVDNASMETWKNDSAGLAVLKRLDHRGDLTKDELIPAGKVFHITTQERRINQEMTATEDLDMFKNGMLRPFRLLDGTEDAAEIASNPNLMSESDMAALLKTHHKTFVARLQEIHNPITLNRLREVAVAADSSVSRVEAINTRMKEVAPNLFVESDSSVAPAGGYAGGMTDKPGTERRDGHTNAVTPR